MYSCVCSPSHANFYPLVLKVRVGSFSLVSLHSNSIITFQHIVIQLVLKQKYTSAPLHDSVSSVFRLWRDIFSKSNFREHVFLLTSDIATNLSGVETSDMTNALKLASADNSVCRWLRQPAWVELKQTSFYSAATCPATDSSCCESSVQTGLTVKMKSVKERAQTNKIKELGQKQGGDGAAELLPEESHAAANLIFRHRPPQLQCWVISFYKILTRWPLTEIAESRYLGREEKRRRGHRGESQQMKSGWERFALLKRREMETQRLPWCQSSGEKYEHKLKKMKKWQAQKFFHFFSQMEHSGSSGRPWSQAQLSSAAISWSVSRSPATNTIPWHLNSMSLCCSRCLVLIMYACTWKGREVPHNRSTSVVSCCK